MDTESWTAITGMMRSSVSVLNEKHMALYKNSPCFIRKRKSATIEYLKKGFVIYIDNPKTTLSLYDLDFDGPVGLAKR